MSARAGFEPATPNYSSLADLSRHRGLLPSKTGVIGALPLSYLALIGV